jgi:hypothetical protein
MKMENENKPAAANIGELIQWPIKTVSIDQLKPFARNPRKISKEGYARLKAKILAVGFNTPILATHDLRIIGGHQRIKVLKELGVREVQVSYAPYEMTEAQFRKALMEANVNDGEYEMGMLAEDFEIYELEEYGVEDAVINKLRTKVEITAAADEEVPKSETAISKLGDIWLCGDHRVMCGDATSSDTVAMLQAATQWRCYWMAAGQSCSLRPLLTAILEPMAAIKTCPWNTLPSLLQQLRPIANTLWSILA